MAGIIDNLGENDVVWLAETGFCLLEMGDVEAARETFEGLVEIEPGNASWRAALGEAFSREGNLGEARSVLRKAVEIDPELAYARCLLGDALVRSKQKDPGLAELKKAIELDPEGPVGATAKTIVEGVDADLYPTPPGEAV